MTRTFTAAVLLVACDGGLDPMVPPEQSVVGEETPLVPPPDNPPDDSDPPPSGDCFADFNYAVNFVTDVTGTDVYDTVDTTRVLYQERDEGNDGSIDVTVTYEYDPNGWLVAKTTDEEALGTLLETWTRDDEGRELLYIEDHFADGIPEHTIDRTYDAYGGLDWVSVDDDGDGVADLVLTWTRDPTGDPLTQEVDSNGDGILDFAWAFTYDSVGRQIVGNGDRNADGSLNILATTTYTDPVLEIGTTNMDSKGNGSIEEILMFERDALGRSLWEGTDEDANGNWDLEIYTTWDGTLDLPPLSVETFVLDTPDGPIHQVLTSTYDELGRRLSFHEELEVNSVLTDTLSTWSFQGSCP